ncbi:MAG: hypothetical protein IJZ91_00645 [Oscillospiraceae bacterium]|nr:hypothetical protein [Oscillospiraceae bacterium]
MKNLSFSKVFWTWFALGLLFSLFNAYTFKSPLLHSVFMASLGVFLLIHPVWPGSLRVYWSEKKCRVFIRILAVFEIIFSFMTRMSF